MYFWQKKWRMLKGPGLKFLVLYILVFQGRSNRGPKNMFEKCSKIRKMVKNYIWQANVIISSTSTKTHYFQTYSRQCDGKNVLYQPVTFLMLYFRPPKLQSSIFLFLDQDSHHRTEIYMIWLRYFGPRI